MIIELKTGLKYGEDFEKELETKELTTADIMDAQTASEVVRFDKEGNPVLVQSPALFGYEILRRQIKRVGRIDGPLSLGQLRSLSQEDLNLISMTVEAQERLKAEQVVNRGRVDAASQASV